MLAELAGQEYRKNTFNFDLYDQQCMSIDLKDVLQHDTDGAIDIHKAMERAGEYTEEDPKLTEKVKKQFKKWRKAFKPHFESVLKEESERSQEHLNMILKMQEEERKQKEAEEAEK